jgi:hypothetical protein
MVPLAAIGGRPVIGCICADGSFKVSCPMLREALAHRHGAAGETACCGHRHREHASCDCCGSESKSNATEGSLVNTKCCHPVVQAPVLPPLGDLVTLGESDQRLSVVPPIESDSFAGPGHCTCVDDDTGLPKPDLVVTLRRLVI